MKKLLCLFLALLMVLPIIACAAKNETDDNADTLAKNDDTATAASEEETSEPLELDEKTFGKDINFLVYLPGTEWDAVDIFSEGESKDLIKSAIWDRNCWLLDTYGITVKQIPATLVDTEANVQFKSNSTDYDAYVSPISSAATMSSNGYLIDLLSGTVPGINLTKSWWDSRASDGFQINGKLFYATGEILTIDNDATFIMMFNKDMVEDKTLESPYELVTNFEWTIEKCKEMMTLVAKDTDGAGFDYKTDYYGLAGGQEMVLGFFYGCGLSLITRNSDGELEFNLSSKNVIEKADKYFEWAKSAIYNDNLTVVFHEVGTKDNYQAAMDCFVENRSLFYGECLQCVTRMRAYDINFGIIPYPQFDVNQKSYYGYVNTIGQVVSIPTNCSDVEMTGYALEAMAYKSQSTLTPAYYDKSLIAKGTKDAESEPMLQIVLANRIYDLGYIFGWGGFPFTDIAKKGAGLTSNIATYEKKITKAMGQTLKKYDKLG